VLEESLRNESHNHGARQRNDRRACQRTREHPPVVGGTGCLLSLAAVRRLASLQVHFRVAASSFVLVLERDKIGQVYPTYWSHNNYKPNLVSAMENQNVFHPCSQLTEDSHTSTVSYRSKNRTLIRGVFLFLYCFVQHGEPETYHQDVPTSRMRPIQAVGEQICSRGT